jgi:16S rRNA C967 or C1407 C5-methylase (RsmB/RsmF family)/NOL1/NOP2/fmu family ribosome biogenesis protein
MSIPLILLKSLDKTAGFNREAFEKVHESGEQVTSIRLNPLKPIIHSPWVMGLIPWCPYGRYLSTRPSFTLDPLLHAGAYYVQEASSMFLWHALKEVTGCDTHKKVLDLCAAPGGKTTLLASYFTDGLIVANEVIKSRAAVLVENITKWGSDHVVVTNNDPSHFQSLPGYFDVLVVDAPCSGSGLFRKDPGAITEWSEDNVQLCSQRQQRILSDTLPALKEDGILIYSTCSYSVEEDESIADWLVAHLGMESKRLNIHTEWNIVETVSSLNAYGYRFYPDKIKGEGFFITVFQKKGRTAEFRLKEQTILQPSRQEWQQINSFLQIPEEFTLFKQSESIRTLKKKWLPDLQLLAKCLYIKKAGIEIGSIKGKDVIPDHELAVSLLSQTAFTSIELTQEQALQYLRRKELVLENAPKGWNLVIHGGLPLGWVKVLPNRVNNYYPAEWRILKE